MLVNFNTWIRLNEEATNNLANDNRITQFYNQFADALEENIEANTMGTPVALSTEIVNGELNISCESYLEDDFTCLIKITLGFNFKEPSEADTEMLNLGLFDFSDLLINKDNGAVKIKYSVELKNDDTGEVVDSEEMIESFDITDFANSFELTTPKVETLAEWIQNTLDDYSQRIVNKFSQEDEEDEDWDEEDEDWDNV
jgi:hypothetical protein